MTLKVTTFHLKGLVRRGASPHFLDSLEVSLVKNIKQLSSSLKFTLVSLCVIFFISYGLNHCNTLGMKLRDSPIQFPILIQDNTRVIGTRVIT